MRWRRTAANNPPYYSAYGLAVARLQGTEEEYSIPEGRP